MHIADFDILRSEDGVRNWCKAFLAEQQDVAGIIHLAPMSAQILEHDASVDDCKQQIQVGVVVKFGL